MSQLKLKQILEFLSTSPANGEVLSYNSGSGKYENSALPNTFGLPYVFNTATSGSVASGKIRFDNLVSPSTLTVSETTSKSSPAAVSLDVATFSSSDRKSIIVIAKSNDGNVNKSFYVNSVIAGTGERTLELEPISSSNWSNISN